MNPTPLTVIIPVYNGENFLAETIASVLRQTRPPAEILVIDDGSTDQTSTIAAGFGESIRLVRRKNAGVSATRNYGLSIAKTDWVALLDHDDLWEPDHLQNLADAVAADPSADICYSGARRLVQDARDGVFRPTKPLVFPPAHEMNSALMDRCAFITSSIALRRSAALDVGGFDSHYLNLQDWDLWLRMRQGGAKFISAPRPTLLYRVHPASRTNNPLRALRYSKEVVEKNIMPHYTGLGRWVHHCRVISRLEGEAAILLRQNGMDKALPLMLRSIRRYPLHELRRYKILLHMLFFGYRRVKR